MKEKGAAFLIWRVIAEHPEVGGPVDCTIPMFEYGDGRVNVGVEVPSWATVKAVPNVPVPLHPNEIPPEEPGEIAGGVGIRLAPGQFGVRTDRLAGTVGKFWLNCANPTKVAVTPIKTRTVPTTALFIIIYPRRLPLL